MTFSDFAQMMYPLIGNGKTSGEFITHLTDQIMENSNSDDDQYNPLYELEANTLVKIYNGKREISRKNAIIINSHLDKSNFHHYLMDFPTDVIVAIASALEENQIQIVNDDIIETCTDLFASILYDCAKKRRKAKSNKDCDAISQFSKKFPCWNAQLIKEKRFYKNFFKN